MVNEIEIDGRIAQLQKQRNDALDNAAFLNGKLLALSQELAEVSKQLEELKRRATESVEADSAPLVQ